MIAAGFADQPTRLLFVHAHPDDETLVTGGTMATHVAAGAQVTLLTCTRGEQGEVIGEALAHLVAEQDDALGEHRVQELSAAMVALGVRDHRFLGEHRGHLYRDSGMTFDDAGQIVLPHDVRPHAFALADLDVAAADVVAVLRDVRPQVVVTYEAGGGYGHPDHVQAHRVVTRAIELLHDSGEEAPMLYWVVTPESVFAEHQARLAHSANPFGPGSGEPSSMVCPDDQVDVAIDVRAQRPAVVAALRAHATQVYEADPYFALSNDVGQVIPDVEYFRRASR